MNLRPGLATILVLVPLYVQQQRPPSSQQDPEGYAKFLEGAERVSRMQVPRVLETLGESDQPGGASVRSLIQ